MISITVVLTIQWPLRHLLRPELLPALTLTAGRGRQCLTRLPRNLQVYGGRFNKLPTVCPRGRRLSDIWLRLLKGLIQS